MLRVSVTTCAVRSTARAGRRPAFQAGGAITALDRPTGLHFHSKPTPWRRRQTRVRALMTRHPFDCDFRVTPEQKIQFQRDGCVRLDGFLNGQVLRMLRDRVEVEMHRETDNSTTPALYRVNYDVEGDKDGVFNLLARRYFRQALTDLTDNDLFLRANRSSKSNRTPTSDRPGMSAWTVSAFSTRMSSVARSGRHCNR